MRQMNSIMRTFMLASVCAIAFGMSESCSMMKTAPALNTTAGSPAGMPNAEGITHYNQEHWDVAKQYFTEAVKSDSMSAEAHYNLALALDKSGDHEAASTHFQRAKELGTNNPEIQQSGILQGHVKKY